MLFGERCIEHSNSDSFSPEIDDVSQLAKASTRRNVFLATFISHLIDSCCLANSFFNSKICASNCWQQTLVALVCDDKTFDEFVCGDDDDACKDADGRRGGSVVTKLVLNCAPFCVSATVQMSKISFATFSLRSASVFVSKRFLLYSAISSEISTFLHSATRLDFEAISSSNW